MAVRVLTDTPEIERKTDEAAEPPGADVRADVVATATSSFQSHFSGGGLMRLFSKHPPAQAHLSASRRWSFREGRLWPKTVAVMWNRARTALGYGLLVVGVAGVLLPIIPGSPFLIAAVALLGADHPVIRPWKERVNRWIKKNPTSKEMNQ
jgi:hypothetical protein